MPCEREAATSHIVMSTYLKPGGIDFLNQCGQQNQAGLVQATMDLAERVEGRVEGGSSRIPALL